MVCYLFIYYCVSVYLGKVYSVFTLICSALMFAISIDILEICWHICIRLARKTEVLLVCQSFDPESLLLILGYQGAGLVSGGQNLTWVSEWSLFSS